ncbi:MAG: hypothetical protein HRT68_02295 [Flavobacteriaceae bacterium]|nr:hypothetical protein [Flavobacteriaceae bacterium]
MRIILIIVFLAAICSIIYGFSITTPNDVSGDKFIGLGTLGLFFVWMPLFIYHRYRGKSVKKYMITDETFKKIKDEAETFLD